MYNSPIEIICGDIQKQIDNDIYRVTQKYDIKVDKNELIQALQYDRGQYDKGYADGKADAMAELVRCKDCKYYWLPQGFCEHDRHEHHTSAVIQYDDDFCSYGERREGE